MKINGMALPPPGLGGDYRGSCVACLHGTDTGLAFAGEAEFAAAGLYRLGMSQREAIATVEMRAAETGADMDNMIFPVRVCTDCATKAGMPVGVVPNIPMLRVQAGAA